MTNFIDGKAKPTKFSRVNADEYVELEQNANTPASTTRNFLYVDSSNVLKYWNRTAIIDLSGDVDSTRIDADLIQSTSVVITAAQVKALAATQITLVAAQGADTVIELISANFKLTYGSEVFTETDDNLAIKYTDDSGVTVSDTIEMTGFIDQTADTITSAIPIKDAIVTVAGSSNQALVLDNINDEIAGNASNDSTLTVYVSYRVINVA